jgi:O-antigen ligase
MLVIGGNHIDPNNLVALYSVGVSISLYKLLFSSKHKIINVIILCVNLYVIFLSGSRSGVVVLASIFIVSAYYYQKKFDSFLKKSMFLIISGVTTFGVFILSQKLLPGNVFLRLFGNENLSFFNSTGRDVIWRSAIHDWYENGLLFGLGWGGHEAHNTFLTILVDVGIIGASFLFIALILIFYRCLKQKNILAIMLFITGMVPSILIGAQNKRFFWNALIVPLLILNSKRNRVSINST